MVRTLLLSAALLLPLASFAEDDLADQMEKAIAMLRETGNAEPSSISMMLSSCAEGYIQRGDFETALARIEEAIALAREHDLDPMMPFFTASKILSQTDDEVATGFLLRELQAPDASLAYKKGVLKALDLHLAINGNQKLALQAAWELWDITKQENPGTEEEFWAAYKYGNHCLTGKLYDLAGPAIREAREIARALGKPELEAHCVRSLGFALSANDEMEQAVAFLEEAVALSRADPQQLFLKFELQNLGLTFLQLDRLDEAETTLAEAMKLADEGYEKGLVRSYQAALALKRALADSGGRKPELGAVIEMQQEAIAEKLTNDAIGEEFAYLGVTPDNIALASFHLIDGNPDAAEEALSKSARGADAWEANSRTAQQSGVFSADRVNLNMADIRAGIFAFQQQVDLVRGDAKAALVTTENGRGTAQAELLRTKMGVEPSNEVKKSMTYEEIAATASEHDTTLVIYSLIDHLAPDTQKFFARDHPLRHPKSLLVWVLGPDGALHHESVPMQGSIHELVEAARSEITKPAEEAPAQSAVDILSNVLLGSVLPHLPKEEGASVTIVPQGPLFLVPFAALPVGGDATMIDLYTLSLSPSVELLRLAAEQRKAVEEAGKSEFLIVGNPTMPGYQVRPDRDATALSPLPGAEAEAKFLAQALNATPLIGDDATEQAVAAKMEDARYLHFATHGLLETENAFNEAFLSALAFAPSPGEDGFLTVAETARMDLNAELAVLSACDTGRGRISGDGVIGLTRGFVTAGVPTVVVSLWPVSDQATAVLMGNYYEAMAAGGTKAGALRDAILETKKEFPAPNLWAPFVLYGLAE